MRVHATNPRYFTDGTKGPWHIQSRIPTGSHTWGNLTDATTTLSSILQSISIPEITLEEAFVRKVIDTVSDLDNVLFEIGNEGDLTSLRWQYHFIRFLKDCEKGKPKQHPVGMTSVFNILNGSWATHDDALWDSPADWISPGWSKREFIVWSGLTPPRGRLLERAA